MPIASTSLAVQERELLAAARGGDEDAYRRLVEPHRGELHAHCYRMLGSLHDAEDALQEALLRAWRGLPRFEGRSSLRSWLYTIATNTCLTAIEKRPKRVLPVDYGPATDPHQGPGEPLVESVWVEPYPDEKLGVEDGLAAPEARYERRESVELAFIAALQHLPARQRAVLVLREVLGFSAREVAETLKTTTASVNSALQRARAAVEERLPEQSQQATLRSLGDKRVREIVQGYVDAWDRGDVDAVVSMLADDATFAMPPLRSWFGGREAIRIFLAGWPLSGAWRWRYVDARANGQEAIAFYTWDDDAESYLPFALNVFTLRGAEISDVTAFVTRSIELPEREVYARWPEQTADPRRLVDFFERFGLPDQLPG
ncbi:MAG TPA: sigma-70 family RNA polymerase sigma factor [Gaiellaceae bacterium]|jgi:RNA polymerase sigma-70 factor (ECF subfamily)|nr:sigma-70 family RNA polymerase sigma factor [Gaiellaceae bacterium]